MSRATILAVLLPFLLGACAEIGRERVAPGPEPDTMGGAACIVWFRAMDGAVDRAGVRDTQALPVPGHPYFRVNRFLASFRDDGLAAESFTAWAGRLRRLDRRGRAIEYANLNRDRRAALDVLARETIEGADNALGAIRLCGDRLSAVVGSSASARAAVLQAAVVEDSYSDWKRVLGLYPLSAIGVALGFEKWKSKNLPVFTEPVETWRPAGTWRLYRPSLPAAAYDPDAVRRILASAPRDALGIPDLTQDARSRLVEAFAPVFLVDTVGAYDDVGAPVWRDGAIEIDAAAPTLFHYLSFARTDAAILPQISYMLWFPERPRQGVFDLLSGRFDAVMVRVTLSETGVPLVYDTIHACGCYHLFFPVGAVTPREPPSGNGLDEWFEVPVVAPDPEKGWRLMVRVASASHYVQGLAMWIDGGDPEHRLGGDVTIVDLDIADADRLRGLADGRGGRRSVYGPDGLVAGSERGERFLLWPMGIASPGAMRQWGHHATAFVGRRHFDDPWLIRNGFEIDGGEAR